MAERKTAASELREERQFVRRTRDWNIALAHIRDGIEELFEVGEDEEHIRLLLDSQLRQVIEDRERR